MPAGRGAVRCEGATGGMMASLLAAGPRVPLCYLVPQEYLPEELVFHTNYLGSDQPSFTLNFSKGASMIIAQYYQVGGRDCVLHITCITQFFEVPRALHCFGATMRRL
jgi:hypothetical protein